MSADISGWAVIGFNDESGLGRMFQDFLCLLPEVRRIVAPSIRCVGNPLGSDDLELLAGASDDDLRRILRGLKGIVFFQEPVHERLISIANELRVRLVCVPMWEWFNPFFSDWNRVDHFVAPNKFCREILQRYKFRNASVIPWALNVDAFPERIISGPARTFLHCTGIYEKDDRKACLETVRAFEMVSGPDLRLIVRSQNEVNVQSSDPRITFAQENLPNKADLYREGDVAIQPSKAEGLGFGLLEPMACGLPIITLDYPPMNEYVHHSELLVRTKCGTNPAIQSTYIPQAHLKRPSVWSLARRIRWCVGHDMEEISLSNRRWVETSCNRAKVRGMWLEVLSGLAGTAVSKKCNPSQ